MKYVFAFFIGVIISSCQPQKEEVSKHDYPGIKIVLESFHSPIGKVEGMEYSQEVSEDTFMYESHFNRKGQLIKKSKYDSDGNLKSTSTFKYDSRGNCIREDELASNGLLIRRTTSQFDGEGYLIERNEVDAGDQVVRKQRLEYNCDGSRWMVTYKKAKGRLAKSLECVFDRNGLNTINHYYTHETLKKKEINAYGPDGNRIQTDHLLPMKVQFASNGIEKNAEGGSYLDDGTLKKTEEHEYDSNGNRIATHQHFPLTNQGITTRYNYGPGRLETATLLRNKMVSSKKVSMYDDQQNVIETFRYGLGGRLEEHQRHLYEYDQAGNWTKHKTIVNNKAVSMAIRQIEHY